MAHYVCPECKGVAQAPQVCETEGCGHKGHDLKECNCTDGQHQEVTQG